MGSDSERLDDALYVVHGSRGSGGLGRLLYAVYLVAIFAGIYGFTLWRGVLVSSDPEFIDTMVRSGWGLGAIAVVVAGLVGLAWRLGSVRGPVVPPLPFIDQVVAGPLDRAIVLRERLALTLLGGGSIGLLLGAIFAGGVVGSGVGGVGTVAAGAAAGLATGLASALAWFAGQAGTRPRALVDVRHGLATGLRGLRLEELRRHAIRSTHAGGAVLAGDLRAVRLDVAAPVTRARGRRLRAAGRYPTIMRRDLLGLRRTPFQVVTGACLTIGGSALAAVSLTQAGAPVIVAGLAAVALYFGFGALAEGVRLVADNAGTTPLIGLGFRAEAAAHLVVPVTAFLALATPITALLGSRLGGQPWVVAGAVVVLAGLLCAATLLAAFRGAPPEASFVPEFGPIAMTYWYARPLTLAAVSGGLLINRVAHAGPNVGAVLVGGAGSALVLIGVGFYLARKLELGHRI